MKNKEIEKDVREFSKKVAGLDKTNDADRLFYESGVILQKFIFSGLVDTKLYEEFAELRYRVYRRKKSNRP